MKDVRIMKTVQMLISVIEDFVVIAVESKIGLFLLNSRSMFLGSVQPYCKGYICLFLKSNKGSNLERLRCMFWLLSHQGSEDAIRNISLRIGDSSGTTSPNSTRSSKISSAKTSDFLDFTETKSKSNSWRTTIHLLIFPLITRRVNTY
jgi:hypothetical protein